MKFKIEKTSDRAEWSPDNPPLQTGGADSPGYDGPPLQTTPDTPGAGRLPLQTNDDTPGYGRDAGPLSPLSD